MLGAYHFLDAPEPMHFSGETVAANCGKKIRMAVPFYTDEMPERVICKKCQAVAHTERRYWAFLVPGERMQREEE